MQRVLRNRGIYARPVRVHRKILGRCSGGVPRDRASSRAECPAGIWEVRNLDAGECFCHTAQRVPGNCSWGSSPSQHANRLLRKARNALFDGMHFGCGSELAAYESEAIAERLAKLHAELEITVSSIVKSGA